MNIKIDREQSKQYAICLKALTNEELVREIWMLEEHVAYLFSLKTGEDFEMAKYYEYLVEVAKEEKEMRMVHQGYQ